MKLLNKIFKFIKPIKYDCDICNDTGRIEVIVMGTDTEFVDCPYCSKNKEYIDFQRRHKQ